jgi:exonuclease III
MRVGTPNITERILFNHFGHQTSNNECYTGYMIAEFSDFCVINTHLQGKNNDRRVISDNMIDDSIVQSIKNKGKPIYICGDFNVNHDIDIIRNFTHPKTGNFNFIVLNDTTKIEENIFIRQFKAD